VAPTYRIADVTFGTLAYIAREKTYALVRTISFSSVSSVYFPCMSPRICFMRSTLCTKVIRVNRSFNPNIVLLAIYSRCNALRPCSRKAPSSSFSISASSSANSSSSSKVSESGSERDTGAAEEDATSWEVRWATFTFGGRRLFQRKKKYCER
jgi:hypothetical protein